MELKLALWEWSGRFDMEKAVCNHDSSRSVPVTISHPLNHPFLLIQVHHSSISSADEAVILEQIGRTLRISNKDERDVMEFQGRHSSARENGLGRILRSPSFFGDAVKSILLCNCRSLDMARALCLLQPKIALDGNARLKRKRSKCSDDIGNFPSWKELLAWSWVHDKYLIKQYNILYQKLLKIKGSGPFVCSNIMMCVGFYQRIPSGSEAIRHLKQVHGKQNCSKETIGKDDEEIHGKYNPFQCYKVQNFSYYYSS
ncbi:hypothetical protein ES319_D07G252700v1 [Gossypium barbadense]|uniref:HhH-GPD domain-containing protein n=1 Tax=Gossypium barbadense TaxID=3634 RepID=A0A5J5QY69_GOSBA|nr:hypothetical protein ES319_D07G252700v1 [Gossypium barbadense]